MVVLPLSKGLKIGEYMFVRQGSAHLSGANRPANGHNHAITRAIPLAREGEPHGCAGRHLEKQSSLEHDTSFHASGSVASRMSPLGRQPLCSLRVY